MSQFHSSTESKEYRNGNLVSNVASKLNYDGKNLDLMFRDDDEELHHRLAEPDLMDIINEPVSTEDLEQRLLAAFPLKKRKQTKRKKNSSSKNKKKSPKDKKKKRKTRKST